MRRLDLSAELPGSVEEAWAALLNTGRWPGWSTLVARAEGELVPGHRWRVEIHDEEGTHPRPMRPYFVSQEHGQRLVFETRLAASWVVRMRHTFELEPVGARASVLHQHFEATGLLVPLLWPWLRAGMLQFDRFGVDLACFLDRVNEGS